MRQVAHLDLAAVLFQDAIADAQAQTGSLSHRLGGVKRIENAVRVLNRRAILGELDENAIGEFPRANPDFAASFLPLARTASTALFQDVEKYLLELMEVAGRSGEIGIQFAVDKECERDSGRIHAIGGCRRRFC